MSRPLLVSLGAALISAACARPGPADAAPPAAKPALDLPARPAKIEPVVRTDAEWRALLTTARYHVLREQGTERAFTGAFHDHHGEGAYRCAACGLDLFVSKDKFDSGTGWPSYTRPAAPGLVAERVDRSHGTVRREAHCPRCGGHLGHVFEDGPAPTGRRYCINSAALVFEGRP